MGTLAADTYRANVTEFGVNVGGEINLQQNPNRPDSKIHVFRGEVFNHGDEDVTITPEISEETANPTTWTASGAAVTVVARSQRGISFNSGKGNFLRFRGTTTTGESQVIIELYEQSDQYKR